MKVRIARFQNCYGPEGTWTGGREKAPAAICRKVAKAEDGGTIEVWGDGTAIRAYTYIDDMIEGIYLLMHSELEGPVNLGSDGGKSNSCNCRVSRLYGFCALSAHHLCESVVWNFGKARTASLG